MTASVPPQAPYSALGNLLRYVGQGVVADWRDNTPFHADLKLDEVQRGSISARFTWRDQATNARYPMLLPGMADLLNNGTVAKGIATGWWLVELRGQSYGLRLATPQEVAEALGDAFAQN
jgi:hypothetical protein